VLSDPASRKQYDASGLWGEAAKKAPGGSWNPRPSQNFHFRRNQQAGQRFYLTRKERLAASRVMSLHSMEHMRSVLLNDEGVMDRHGLLALYAGGPDSACAERLKCVDTLSPARLPATHAPPRRYGIKFPFPFAHQSDTFGIWWEDVLQAMQADAGETDVAAGLGIPPIDPNDLARCPTLVWLNNGTRLETLAAPEALDNVGFERWVWDRLSVRAAFVNEHYAPIQLMWLHGSSGRDMGTLEPGEVVYHQTMISHVFLARDARVTDGLLSDESLLARFEIRSSADIFRVRSRCFDMNGECKRWAARGECKRNLAYMSRNCRLSCDTCDQAPGSEQKRWRQAEEEALGAGEEKVGHDEWDEL